MIGVSIVLAGATPARADLTGFIGATTTPDTRQTRGVAISVTLVMVGFEFEYASTSENADPAVLAPALKTGMGNVFVQTPVPIWRIQPYLTAGAGVYNESLTTTHDSTGVALNTGGGVKVSLAGPLQLRVDYRVFRLDGGALYSPAHRVYAGLNLKF
jgi:hypothetical protein